MMRPRLMIRLIVLGVVAAAALSSSAHAQTPLYTLDTPNPQAGARFGWSLAVGDVNGDGKDDIIVGARGEDVGSDTGQGRVYVFSGVGGSLLLNLTTPNPQPYAYFGSTLAVGDVNGDGKGDIAVGAYGGNSDQGRAYVFSGADGSLLLTLEIPSPEAQTEFGFHVAMGDVNGDGKADIVVGATSTGAHSILSAFSGADGSLLFSVDRSHAGWLAITSVAVGDVNGDGKGEIVEGEIAWGSTDFVPQWALVSSGVDGSPLYLLGAGSAYGLGVSVATGDVNGDGKADIAVGALNTDEIGYFRWGLVLLYSGVDGSELGMLSSPDPDVESFGASVAVGDVDGDGKGDIIVGGLYEYVYSYGERGRAYVFSGADHSLRLTLDAPDPLAYDNFGGVRAGDVNGDGKADIIVAADAEDVGGNTAEGRVYVFASGMPTPTPASTATSTPRPTPTPTRRPFGVGGIVNLPPAAVAAYSDAPSDDSGWPAGAYAGLAGVGAAVVIVLGAGGWYAGRRRLR